MLTVRAALLVALLVVASFMATGSGAALPCLVPVPVVCAEVITGGMTVQDGEVVVLDGDAYYISGPIEVQTGGTLILGDGQFTFDSGEFIIRDNATVEFQGSRVQAVGPQMRYVNVAVGARLRVVGATFDRAEFEIYSNDSDVRGSSFTDSMVELVGFAGTFQGNSFTGGDDLHVPLHVIYGPTTVADISCAASGPQQTRCVASNMAEMRVVGLACTSADAPLTCLYSYYGGPVAASFVTCYDCHTGVVFNQVSTGEVTSSHLRDRADPTSTGIIAIDTATTVGGARIEDFGVGIRCVGTATLTLSTTVFPGTPTPTEGC